MNISRKDLIKRIDRLFQSCRRYDGAVKKNGVWYNRCVTSGELLPISKCDAGHWIPRACYETRWEEWNCHCQSKRDNCFRNGAYIEYSNFIIKKYGMKLYEEALHTYDLHKRGKIPALKISEIREKYDYWLKKGRELEQKIGPTFPASWKPVGPEFIEVS